jgi:ribonuclease HII
MLCGIDEAGRGCLAGPLVVAGVVLHSKVEGLNDSKQLSEKKREKLYEEIIKNSTYHIVMKDNNIIDEIGLSPSLQNSIKEIMQSVDATSYLMDGNTSFGIPNLDFMIKADAKVEEVSAASILAKVTRDRYMVSLNDTKYGFSKHKGYGTKAHIEAIREYGYSKLHRKTFQVKSLIQPTLF